tara:strand:+ start:5008 stop:5733 length:726 start_codon:yes stop_codon:yes gene_type:complete
MINIYNNYINELNKIKFKSRYEGKENFFHASSAGLCKRKHYFGAIQNIKPKEPDNLSRLRLGDIVHNDIQKALKINAKEDKDRWIIEGEITIEELNVRGHFDVLDLKEKKLIDIKTIGGYKWKMLFGNNAKDKVTNYKMQIGTYGIGIEKKYCKLKKMSLMFYKLGDPNAGTMRELPVSLMYMEKAKEYWQEVNKELNLCKENNSLPRLALGSSPAEGWECNPQWCGFFKDCLGGMKPELL